MNEQRLEMKYHPAKKEVRFKRFDSGKEVEIRRDSKLRNYMNDHGNFVLQYQGNEFFEAIAGVFDGYKAVQVDVITTQLDYEDFEQMVEYYNKSENSAIEITTTQLAKLPDMDAIYREVKKHGEESIRILEKHLGAIRDIPLNDKRVRGCVDDFAKNINTEKSSIRDKMDKMTNDHINLCFAGVYSAGKSALINAILGHRILPESVKSETAKMFRIESPKPNASVRIVFGIKDGTENHHTILQWDEKSDKFVFDYEKSPSKENAARKALQDIIDANKAAERHDQMLKILEALNSRNDIDADIKVYFPIPLDNERVHFAIYDTPGTDSNVVEHQRILQDALSEQTHSILLFVAAPTKMEGEGNHALLSYLKAAEEKDSKTSIDLGRSLFVINWADSIKASDRVRLQREKIQLKGGDFAIDLSDKKLFFTSAKLAYLARAKILGVQIDEEDEESLEETRNKIDKEHAQYFRQNRSAASEYATQKMLETSAAALEEAKQTEDTLSAAFICSGLYALEEEIKVYGEKYATAVRAFAIIDSIDKALVKVKTTVAVLQNKNEKNLDEINREIESLRKTIEDSIQEAYKKQQPSEAENEHYRTLGLGGNDIHQKIAQPTLSFIERQLQMRWGGLRNPKFKPKEDSKAISEEFKKITDSYIGDFCQKRNKLLKEIRDAFISDVKLVIKNNGDITDEAKAFVGEIRVPESKPPSDIKGVEEIYNTKKTETWFFHTFTGIDKKGFKQVVDSKLTEITRALEDDFKKDFKETLDCVLSEIKEKFNRNLEQYSRLMRAKHADKEAMDMLGGRIRAAATELEDCQEELETTIWREKK